MRKIIKKIIILTFYYSGLNWVISKLGSNKVYCIGYHSICDEKNKKEFSQKLYTNISVNVSDFEKQIRYLKNNNHTFIHFSDLKKPETRFLNKPTTIFFDDGFKDVLANALPILKKYNVPATIFITTGLIERTHFLWTLAVRHFFSRSSVDNVSVEHKIKEFKKLSMVDRNAEINKMFATNSYNLNPQNFNIFLNWDEVKQLTKNGFEVGSHGVEHQKLTELPQDKLRDELMNSRKVLEDKVGSPVTLLSYPYGRHNDKVIEIAQKTGYNFGVSTITGSNNFNHLIKHPFEIKRINPEEDDSAISFKVRLYTNI